MADVRSMLQGERAARRIKHPQASYTSSGALSCSICRTAIKSEAFWDSHLRSVAHTSRLREPKAMKAARLDPSTATLNKKRKNDAEDDQEDIGSKRIRSDEAFRAQTLNDSESESSVPRSRASRLAPPPTELAAKHEQRVLEEAAAQPPTSEPEPSDVDEAEWDALQRELAESERHQATALRSAPTISAKPMTAEELAAQATKEENVRQDTRAQEVEEEREEASRQAEEEMERMAQLDERMKEWRARRDALKTVGRTQSVSASLAGQERDLVNGELANDAEVINGELNHSVDSDGDSEDDDDAWDPWRGLGGSS